MSDYFDVFERELRDAAHRNAHLPWYLRIRSRRSRGLIVALACLVVAGPALAAAGVFQAGTAVAPDVPRTPHANTGVAIPSSVRVLALRASDPSGGPAWGLRFERTTRNLVCVQLGRVDFGTVGALGIDGAFHDDGRFHPFSDNYQDDLGCAVADAHGHGFVSDDVLSMPASAIAASCSATPPKTRSGIATPKRHVPFCSPGSTREIYYGMLGPDALSITYPDAAGRLITRPTAGPDGAFLVVRGTARACSTTTISVRGRRVHSSQCGGLLVGTRLVSGWIRRVSYRGGRTCVLRRASAPRANCPLVGYAAPTTPLVTSTQVASPVTISDEGVQHLCRTSRSGLTPCRAAPPSSRRAGAPEYVLDVSFIARVAVTNANTAYDITTRYPAACGGYTGIGPTFVDLRAGQRVSYQEFASATCAGTIRGTVIYNATRGPNSQQPGLNVGLGRGALVGHFSITLPRRKHG